MVYGTEVQCRIHKGTRIIPIPNQVNPVLLLTRFFKSYNRIQNLKHRNLLKLNYYFMAYLEC